jgi:hypothetical protein
MCIRHRGRGRGRGRTAKQQQQQEDEQPALSNSPSASSLLSQEEPEAEAAARQPGPSSGGQHSSGKRYGEDVVGARLRVYWPGEGQWYAGIITAFERAIGRHHIRESQPA